MHGFLQSTLITKVKAEKFWQCSDSIAGHSTWALCNMLPIISSLCSPMLCPLVNMSQINWEVQNCVREADCCWHNLYFKCSFHKFWPLTFKMATYKIQRLLAFRLYILCKDLKWWIVSIPHKHRANQNINVSGSIYRLTERRFSCVLETQHLSRIWGADEDDQAQACRNASSVPPFM